MNKHLEDKEGDLQERINMFYSNKSDILEEIAKEKINDPSEELIKIEKEVKECDPLKV